MECDIGEAFAVDLDKDIDFEEGILHLKHQLQLINGFWTLRPPKYNSIRDIDLSSKMLSLLKSEKKKQYVQKRLGHKNIKVTLDIYYKLTDKIRENNKKFIEML